MSVTQVVLSVSGGFTGDVREYQLSADHATLVAVDLGRQLKVSHALSAAERIEFKALLTALAPAKPAGPPPGNCADCLNYELRLDTGGGKPDSFQLNSLNLSASPHAALIGKLDTLGKSALQAAADNKAPQEVRQP
jgi:hypothetical protein